MSMNQNVLNMLKIYYKDKVENLLFRNSPVFSKIGKERIEGKSANFAALAGFSGGVGGDYAKALEYASEVGACAQWEVTPGQVFGVVSFNNKEVLASASNKGAFIRTADAKMFTSFDAVKKVLATAFYGRGYGEVCASGYTTAINAGTAFQIANLPEGVIGIKRTNNVQELAEYYSLASVFVNPTYEDNFPTTNIEALSCGTPVITYKTGG